MGVASVTLGQWQVKPGGGPVVTSQDPPLEQGWLWQRSISTSHRWPVVGVRLEVTPGFSDCLLTVVSAHDMWARRCWGLLRGGVEAEGEKSGCLVGKDHLGCPGLRCAPEIPGLTCVPRQTLAIEGVG